MDTEIELKLLVKEVTELEQTLTELATITSAKSRKLYNAYYETPEHDLRQLDIGLRVRCADDYIEQTIKTSGKVAGGLHQRPEYNIPLEDTQPDLTAFPEHIWPEGTDLHQLQSQLGILFSTDFLREDYQLDYAGSVFELAFDRGDIKAGLSSDSISEIEIELKSGEVTELFSLAAKLSTKIPMRIGMDSKAARGYRLVNGQPEKAIERLPFVDVSEAKSLSQAASQALLQGLNYWQKHEDLFVSTARTTYLSAMLKGMGFVFDTLSLYAEQVQFEGQQKLTELLSEFKFVENVAAVGRLVSKRGTFRKKLEKFPKLLKALKQSGHFQDTADKAMEIIWREDYCQCKLLLSSLIYQLASQRVESEDDYRELRRFARRQQQHSLDSVTINSTVEDFGVSEYLGFETQLRSSLRAGLCLASLFDQQASESFRAPWLDILHGIDEIKQLNALKHYLIASDLTDASSLATWCDDKIERTIDVMEQTRHAAKRLEPYW